MERGRPAHQQERLVLFSELGNQVPQLANDVGVFEVWVKILQQEHVVRRVIGNLIQKSQRIGSSVAVTAERRLGAGRDGPGDQALFQFKSQIGQLIFQRCSS